MSDDAKELMLASLKYMAHFTECDEHRCKCGRNKLIDRITAHLAAPAPIVIAEPIAWQYRKYDAVYDEVSTHYTDEINEAKKHDQFPVALYALPPLLSEET